MAIARIETDGIEDSAVDSSKILDGTLGSADITDDSLTNAKFSNSAAIPISKLSGLATSATTDTTNADNITSGSLAAARVDSGTTTGKILILDGNAKLPAVDGSLVTAIAAGNIATGTLPVARIDSGTAANKIVKLDGSGNMPAVDGSQLTGISTFTSSASDPTVSTNPSGGVGTEWINTTSGEVYLCTDATAGSNVWINVGAGTGNIQLNYGGEQYGYCAGGIVAATADNEIAKYSYASDGDATDVGDIVQARYAGAGVSSLTYGYHMGGAWPPFSPTNFTVELEKTQFASDGDAAAVTGDLTGYRRLSASATNKVYGYCVADQEAPRITTYEKFLFSTEANAVSVGTLTGARSSVGCSSSTHGYTAGGNIGAPASYAAGNVIQKWAFASDGTAEDVGDLTVVGNDSTGASSLTHGYVAGGASRTTTIDKFTFASDASATDVGDCPARTYGAGSSSTTFGYNASGDDGGVVTNMFKYSFSSDGNSTSVGNLTYATSYPWGELQY